MIKLLSRVYLVGDWDVMNRIFNSNIWLLRISIGIINFKKRCFWLVGGSKVKSRLLSSILIVFLVLSMLIGLLFVWSWFFKMYGILIVIVVYKKFRIIFNRIVILIIVCDCM